jgi:phospholipid transport system substrate-binding protein
MRRNNLSVHSSFRQWWLLVLAVVLTGPALAKELSPLELVKATVNDVVAEMDTRQDLYSSDQVKLRAMVLERVAPHFNFDRMTQLAMASNWAKASPEQRKQISKEMLEMMVRTYANSMFKFRKHPLNLVDEKIVNDRTALVRLSVTTESGQAVAVMLRMEKRKASWQVIDVVIDGVSMVITYRGTFAEEINKTGIDGLIKSIQTENLQRATS